MLSPATPFLHTYRTHMTAEDVTQEHRARMAFEEETRSEKRRAAQAEQSERTSAPGIRVRAWEKLHELRLPSDAAHPILQVIAAETNLSIAEIRQEQRARKAARG